MQLVGTRLNAYKNTQNICRITKLLQTIKFTTKTRTMQQILLNMKLCQQANMYHVIFFGEMD